MMKRTWIALLLIALILLPGCTTQEGDVDQLPVYLTLAKEQHTEYEVINHLMNDTYGNELADDLSFKTGAHFTISNTETEGKNKIHLGTAEQLKGLVDCSPYVVYTAYEIVFANDDIFLIMPSVDVAETVCKAFVQMVVKTGEGTFAIDKAQAGVRNTADISELVPAFETKSGKQEKLHDSGNGNNLIVWKKMGNAATAEINAYRQMLQGIGYELFQESQIGENQFVTYVKGDTMVYCNYFAVMDEFRLVYGPRTYTAADKPVTDYEKVVTPSVSVIPTTDSCLSMVFQLADGSFVIIDGGWGTSTYKSVTLNSGTSSEYSFSYYRDAKKDMQVLFDFLKSKTPGGGKPQVTWMITHADPDHVTLPTRFIKDYRDQFDLNMICYNFPNMLNIGLTYSSEPEIFESYANGFVNNTLRYFPEAKHFVYHTGQKLYLPGCEIEFLFTASEDYWPNLMTSCNRTSGSWRVTIEGKTVLITGDISEGLNSQMARVFGSYLKSDVLQVVHHGSNGATLGFYKQIQPEVCIWPCLEEYVKYDLRHTGKKSGWEFNKYLWDTAKVHYAASKTTTLLLPSLEEERNQ